MRTMSDFLKDSLTRVTPRNVMRYAESRGWLKFRQTGRLMIFNRPEPSSLDQLLVPADSSRPDFAERMRDVVERLVEFEQRPAATIVTDLFTYDSDVLRYRVDSLRTQRGTLPLGQAFDLLAGARQSLLAAAHSALVPLKYHPKLSRTQAQKLLEACELQQTEQSSFVVAIACPLKAVDQDQAGLFLGEEPFARRSTSLLMRALATLHRAIEDNRVNSIVDDQTPIVSANLCDALLRMRPLQDDGLLEVIPSWALSTPIDPTNQHFHSVRFTNDEFESVEEIYRQLRPNEEAVAKTWLAYVEELLGTDSGGGVREGEIVLSLFDEDQVVRARATLNADDYQTAYEAHNPTRPLKVVGQLHRGPRVSRLSSVSKVELVPVDP